jgi:hypothetical protein
MKSHLALLALATPFVVYYIIYKITKYIDSRMYEYGFVHGTKQTFHARRHKKTLDVFMQLNGRWVLTTRIFIGTSK